jgi:hypothetical protein
MTDRKELLNLSLRMQAYGARVGFIHDGDGYIHSILIEGAKGIGISPMSPISAAERMREWLHNLEKAA